MVELRHVSGFREAEKVLRQLGPKVEERVLQSATSAGARIIAKEVRASAPKGSGEQSAASKRYGRLSKNIKTQVLRIAKARGRRGARVVTGDAFWGFFLEFGTRFITAQPWFRPAIDRSEKAAINKLREFLGRGVEREAVKLARRHKAI